MKGKNRKSVERTSPDLRAERLEGLKELFPEIFTEGKVDLDKLREVLGEEVEDRPERYSFTWAGKRDCIKLLQTPSRATLVPAKEESIDWETTNNVFIEGENLEVLKLLYRSYAGRVKMIYIDPPYNTGNDFIYPDNFADPLDTYLKLTGQKDSEGNLQTSNPETSGRYHSAWLSMIYPRLFLARQLLREDGAIFISIDDHEVYNLRLIMNEIFGEENFVESFIWKKSYGGGAKEKYAVTQHEYILFYAKNIDHIDQLWLPPDPQAESKYYKYRDDKYNVRGPYRIKPLEATKSMDKRDNLIFPIQSHEGKDILPKYQWWWSRERTFKALENDELVFVKGKNGITVSYKQYLKDEDGKVRGTKPFSIIDGIYTQNGTVDLRKLFNDKVVLQFPKPVELMKRLINISTDDERSIIMDFFAGSAPLAQAVLEQNREDGGNRRFVCVQLPHPLEIPEKSLKTIADIAKQRISNVIKEMKDQSKGTLELKEKGLDGKEDLGFRLYRLTESNYQSWSGLEEKDSEKYAGLMEKFHDPLKEGWKAEEVIWQTALGEGYGLNSRIEEENGIKGLKVFRVTDPDKEQTFRICLDDKLKLSDLNKLGLGKEDLFICRDAALDDEAAANLALQCRLKTI